MLRQRAVSLLVDVDGSTSLLPGHDACKLAANGGVKAMMILPSADGITASLGVSKTPPGGMENTIFQRWLRGCPYLAQQLKIHNTQITGRVILNILDHDGVSMLQQKEDGDVYLPNGVRCSKDMAFRFVESFCIAWNRVMANHYGVIEQLTFQKGHTFPMLLHQG